MIRQFCRHCFLLVILSGITGAVLYLNSAAFSERWRGFVVAQLEQRGVHVDFERLGLNLLGGLVAREVRIYNDEGREQLLASLDRVNVEFDYGQLLSGKAMVEGLELTRANVSMPVNPAHPEWTVIELKDFSARVYFRDRHLKVAHATGELAGVRLDVTADLLLGEAPDSEEKRKLAREMAMRRLEVMREYRGQIQRGLDWLARFEFKKAPTLTVELSGATESMEAMEAEASFLVRDFVYRGYQCRELSAEAGLKGGDVDLKRLRLVDGLGSLDARAVWRRGEEVVDFRVTSNADLTSVAGVLLSTDALKEVVFYDQGPSLALEGRWFFGEASALMKRPVDVRGEVHCPRFTSRGEVFEGLSASFGVSQEGIYVRDGMLRHRTGSLALQAMLHEQQGLRYRATLKMDPAVFKPFVAKEQIRALIDRFKFERDSSIYVKLEGKGPTLKFADCRNVGHAEVRGVAHQGVPFVSANGDFEFQGPQLLFRHFKGEREDGPGEVDEVEVQLKEKWVRITGARTKCDPVPLLRSFVPKVAEVVARYRLPSETVVNVNGVFGWGGPDKTDCRVGFASPEGRGIYRLWEEDYEVEAPEGDLLFKRDDLAFEVRGRVHDGPMHAKGTTDLSADRDEFAVAVTLGRFRYPVFGEEQVFEKTKADVKGKDGEVTFDATGQVMGGPMTAKGRATGKGDYDAEVTVDPFRWDVFGKVLAFGKGRAELKARAGKVAFDAGASLMGGQFTAKGMVDTGRERVAYEGEMGVNGLSFAEFSRTYTPGYETDGDLTGHFKFTGELEDWKTLRGEGVGIIVNGNLYAVPILGPLTPLLGGFLPSPIKGFNVAKEATCTYRVENGFVYTDNLEALTAAFRLVAKGNANFIEDKVEFDAQARFRGLPGLVFRPVSELLEYQARGTIGDPAWKPRLFNLGAKEATSEAEKTPAASGGTKPAEEKPEPKWLRLPPFLRPGK